MRYWLKRARENPVPTEMEKKVQRQHPPMDRMRQANFSLIGEEAALASVVDLLVARFANPAAVKSPLVLLLLGPPGHGKTYLTRNIAKALVGENNMLEIACGALRDDADLFGRAGHRRVDGRLTRFLRERQGQRSVVFLDEFEKIQNIVSSLGWEQATKMYMGFLEPWQEGKLTDNSGQGRPDAANPDGQGIIDCMQTVFILTSNWGQREIIDFATANPDRVYGKINTDDKAWLRKELVGTVLQPLVMRKFASINQEISALARRITAIVPFLPLTKLEQRIVADTSLRDHFAAYHDPAIHEGPEEERRLLGNIVIRCSDDYLKHIGDSYNPMEGASSMIKAAQETEGNLLSGWMRKTLPLDEAEYKLLVADCAPAKDSEKPVIWLHHRLPADDVVMQRRKPVRNPGATEEDVALEGGEGKVDGGARDGMGGFYGTAAAGDGRGPDGGRFPGGRAEGAEGKGDDDADQDEGLDNLDNPF
jgi:DNA polymerase III delta prime subunit